MPQASVAAQPQQAWIAVRRLAADATTSADGLTASEQARAQGISAPHRLKQFIAARWLAREVLASGWGGTAEHWQLSASAEEPPRVTGSPDGTTPFVAISHSHDWLACAAGNVPLGVDLEAPTRKRDVATLAQAVCTAEELAVFHPLDKHQQEARFYALWTLKEAWLKRNGEPATPGRMARLHASLADDQLAGGRYPRGNVAQARLWQDGRVTLSLVMNGAALEWAGSPPFSHAPVQDWLVEDTTPPDGAITRA